MISSLPIGDKLSLKGKLFELQKNLNIIELENQSKDELTFRPEILEFALPDRERTFDENVRRAEMIRRQKMEMIKDTLTSMTSAACTFSPQISKRSQQIVDPDYVSRNAFHRLHEKAVESQKTRSDLVERSKKFDANGKRLFSPNISKAPPHARQRGRERAAPSPQAPSMPTTPTSSSHGNLMVNSSTGTSITVGDFMYRDAVDREERHKMRLKQARAEAQRGATSFKNNKKSVEILRRKAEREVRAVFELLDTNRATVIDYSDLQAGVELLCDRGLVRKDVLYKTTEQAWSLLDVDKQGRVESAAFLRICTSFMLHETATGSWVADNSLPTEEASKSLTAASLSFKHPPVNAVPKNEELLALRTVVSSLVKVLKESPDLVAEKNISMKPSLRGKLSQERERDASAKDEHVFSPVISEKSQRLAMSNRNALLQEGGSLSVRDAAATTTPVHGIDLIEQRQKKTKQNQDRLKEEADREVLKHCTFRPAIKIIGKRSKGGSTAEKQSTAPAFERLYALKDIQIRAKTDDERKDGAKAYKVPYVRREDAEMDECIFSPAIAKPARISDELAAFLGKPVGTELTRTEGSRLVNAYIREHNLQDRDDGRKVHPDAKLRALLKIQPESEDGCAEEEKEGVEEHLTLANLHETLRAHFANSGETLPPPPPEGEYAPGFKEAVERVRSHRAYLMREPERRLAELAAGEARYYKGRKLLLAKGLTPPSFLTTERVLKKQLAKARRLEPRLYVDVKLSNTKTACIPILDGDDPPAIAKSFCRIYALDDSARGILEEVVRQSMEANQVRISESTAGTNGASGPVKATYKGDDDDGSDLSSTDSDESSESGTGSGSDDDDSGDSDDDDDEEEDGEETEEEGEKE